jgi:HK97 family phage portal protein
MTARRRRRKSGAGKLAVRRRQPRAAGTISAQRPEFFLTTPFLREAGVPVTADTATQVSAVYGCCRLIVDSLAAAPIRVYENKTDGRRDVLHDDSTAYTLNWGAPVAQAPDAPTAQAIEEALYWSGLLHGNGYAEIQWDGGNRFFALWPIEPDRVTPRREGKDFWYDVMQPYGGTAQLAATNMFHLRGPSLFGWLGDSTVYRAAKAIGIGQALQVFRAAYFANGTVISGLLSSDKIVTPQQADRAIESWNKAHRGPAAAHTVAVTGQGFKFQPIGHNAQESQPTEASRFQVQEIARFFGVPTTLLADNEAWTNLSELYLGFYRNALLPWAERFDAEATRKLFPQRKPWREVQHDLTQLVMGSFKERILALRQAVNGGLKTRNEARAILGDNTIGPAGDVLVVEGTVRPLEQVLAEPPEPAPATPGQQPGMPPDEDVPEEDMPPAPARRNGAAGIARAAVALDRLERRMAARRADLTRNAPEKLDANLAEERKRLEPGVVEECRRALGLTEGPDGEMRARKMIDAVLSGEPAHLAVDRLFGAETIA